EQRKEFDLERRLGTPVDQALATALKIGAPQPSTEDAGLAADLAGEPTPLAITLARRGFKVFPLHAKDRPAMKAWPHQATTAEATIQQGWSTWPDALPGIHCAGLLVLDVDVKNGAKGRESLAELEREHGKLPATCQQTTKSGGRHLLFKVEH